MRLGKSACCVRGFSINLPHSGRDSPMSCGGRAARLLETLIKNRCFLAGSRLLRAPWLPGGLGNGGENPPASPEPPPRRVNSGPFRVRTRTLANGTTLPRVVWHQFACHPFLFSLVKLCRPALRSLVATSHVWLFNFKLSLN